ncbi:putative leader peptide [Streptomyces gelaticus]|nr:putative leader peptide [Streptomyces gelaticus]
MVPHDVSNKTPGTLLVARLHVDLCRLSSAICTRRLPAGPQA